MTEIALSAVAQIVNAFDGEPIEAGRPQFRVDGRRYAAWPKPQGFYAFTGLDDGRHDLEVTIAGFFPTRAVLSVPPSEPLAAAIVVCRLEPAPMFQYPPWASVLRGRVTTAGPEATPLPGVAVSAAYTGHDGGERRVATRSAEGGAYQGLYALALPGRRSGAADVTVTFSASDRDEHVRRVRLEPGHSAFLDVALT